MGIEFMLDPAANLDDFVGSDDDTVDGQVCKIDKRRGGEVLRTKYSESSPLDYWSAKSEKIYPMLKKIAEVVFTIPTSSAASERAWSIFDHIHSKQRNRLSVAKVEMLTYIYINHEFYLLSLLSLSRIVVETLGYEKIELIIPALTASTTSPAIDAALSLLQSVVPVLLTTEAQLASRASKLSSAAIV
ncbi:hypothetical protein F443_22457 [Phytophthora nicotianae P1569]|uniref:HAT C-terminal dimerisation domain-containing protein n=1 Tax=Phytophthora nicotianae P1569 TaxID=1317065 RepID=V9DUX8_PHYNI|nr:hypothetical protein F443_22457 [Phytophthora nicotianae P1569]